MSDLIKYEGQAQKALSIALVSQGSELLKVLGKHIAEQYDFVTMFKCDPFAKSYAEE